MMLHPKIMIVENDPVSAQMTSMIAQSLGCSTVAIHEDGASALQAFFSSPCDIVIVDIDLNGNMDGIQLARQLRKNDCARVIFVSSYASEEVFKEALPLLPIAYLVKPIKAPDLKAAILLAEHAKLHKPPKCQDEWTVFSHACRYNRREKRFEQHRLPIELSDLEHQLVTLLADHMGNCVSYDQILSSLWNGPDVSVDSLRSLVRRLHCKLTHPLISNHYAKGYLIPHPESALSYQI